MTIHPFPTRLRSVEAHPQAPAGTHGFPLPERLVEQAPEIAVVGGVALVETPWALLRVTDPRHLGNIGAAFADAGLSRVANAFWDAELAMSEPQGAA